MNWKTSRRHLLGGAAALAGAAAAGVRLMLPPEAARVVHAADEEEWNGFLILPRGAPVPERVRCEGCEPAVGGKTVETAAEIIPSVPFPLYGLASPPSGVTASGAQLALTKDGAAAYADVTYETDYDTGGIGVIKANTIVISATKFYPKPFPVFTTRPVDAEVEIPPEKVSVKGYPALRTITAAGEVTRWIEDGTLYELLVEAGRGEAFAAEIAASLAHIA